MKRSLVCGILLLMLFSPGTASAGDSGARLQSLTGNVEIRHAGGIEAWASGTAAAALIDGDRIRTGGNSTTIIGFADSSTLVLKPESEIGIDHPTPGKTRIKVVDGHIWINVKKMDVTGALEIEMDSAIAAVTGTNITCSSSRNGGIETDTITTISGEADVTVRSTGEHFAVGEGQQLTIRDGQVQLLNVEINQQASQWNSQLQSMGGSVDLGDVSRMFRPGRSTRRKVCPRQRPVVDLASQRRLQKGRKKSLSERPAGFVRGRLYTVFTTMMSNLAPSGLMSIAAIVSLLIGRHERACSVFSAGAGVSLRWRASFRV